MITKVSVKNFKSLEDLEVDINPEFQLLVGQNNSGKTTIMQAIYLWSFLCNAWQRGKARSGAKIRTGYAIPRTAIYPVPVRSTKDLWKDGQVRVKGETSKYVHVTITVSGIDSGGNEWSYGMQLQHSNDELVYCKPTDISAKVPDDAGNVFYLPPLSGIQTSENKLDPAAQNLAMGEGRPGDIIRNLLFEVYSNDKSAWSELKIGIHELFGISLEDINYNSAIDPDIVVKYTYDNKVFELTSAGSGFLQFLLIATFVFLHKNATLLIDEPDSHLHSYMKRQVVDWLKDVGVKNQNQFVIATHSSAIVERTGISNIQIVPKPSTNISDLKDITGLLRLSNNDVINALQNNFVLWTEDFTDQLILLKFAKLLGHDATAILEKYVKFLQSNDAKPAIKLHEIIRACVSKSFKTCILRDSKTSGQVQKDGIESLYWNEPEIENYLIIPDALINFAQDKNLYGGMFAAQTAKDASDYLTNNLTPNYISKPLESQLSEKGSDFLEKMFRSININVSKSDYYEIINHISVDQVKQEIVEKLDSIVEAAKS